MRSVAVKWSGGTPSTFTINVDDDATIAHLKCAIEAVTSVRTTRIKLLNVRVDAKTPASDEVALASIGKFPKVVMMMGMVESAVEAHANAVKVAELVGEDVEDDFDISLAAETTNAATNAMFLAKIDGRVRNKQMKMLNPSRPGARALVLDIDYTLFDHRTTAETPLELQRPYLHEFLTHAYADDRYDIFIWSATNLSWIELKMTQLGVLTHTDYKIVGLIDSQAMITVETAKYGVFNCKPLGYLWGQTWPAGVEYGPHNTIMFDDLGRNFLMNPQSGLKIRPFRNAHTSRATDRELVHLSRYLSAIAKLDDFTSLNHNKWEKFLREQRENDEQDE